MKENTISSREDAKNYQHLLPMPVLGICTYTSYNYMKMGLPYVAKNASVTGMFDSGHYLYEELPQQAWPSRYGVFLKEGW